MTIKKTAISIENQLFEEVEALAKEMDVPRSRVFTVAIRSFLQQRNNRKLFEVINEAFHDLPDTDEEELLSRMKSKHRGLVKNQW